MAITFCGMNPNIKIIRRKRFSLNPKTPPPQIWHLEGCFVKYVPQLIVETKNVYQTKQKSFMFKATKKTDTGAPH